MAAPEPGPSLVLAGLDARRRRRRASGAPLRGSDLGRVDVVAPAAIAIVDGRIAAVGPPDDVASLARRPRDGGLPRRGRDPGPRRLPHASRLRRRPGRRVRPARPGRRLRAHPRGGRRDPLDGRGDPRASGRTAWRRPWPRTWAGWRPTARRRRRASRGTASIARPSSRASRPWRARIRSRRFRPTSGAHSVPPEFGSADDYLDYAIAEVLPEAAAAGRARRRLPRARRVLGRAGRPVPARGDGPRPRRPAARRPVHRVGRDPARDRARRALGRPPRGDRPGRRRGARREATSRRCSCPWRRSTCAARSRPPGRWSTRGRSWPWRPTSTRGARSATRSRS